jgi:hypothetical protein
MGWAKESFILLLLLASSFAAETVILTGQENTSQFAIDTSAAKCAEGGVAAVYTCSGNAVKAVLQDGGSVFYKPDGRVVSCPDVAPSQMGAECMYLLTPNYCTKQVECGASAENSKADVNISEQGKPAVAVLPPQPVQADVKATAKPAAKDDMVIPAPAPSVADFSLDGLALVVLLLGAVSVGVLFSMFKNSISE